VLACADAFSVRKSAWRLTCTYNHATAPQVVTAQPHPVVRPVATGGARVLTPES